MLSDIALLLLTGAEAEGKGGEAGEDAQGREGGRQEEARRPARSQQGLLQAAHPGLRLCGRGLRGLLLMAGPDCVDGHLPSSALSALNLGVHQRCNSAAVNDPRPSSCWTGMCRGVSACG